MLTVQFSNAPGLEVFTEGSWHIVAKPPEGAALVMAGDMLERLTNGVVKAGDVKSLPFSIIFPCRLCLTGSIQSLELQKNYEKEKRKLSLRSSEGPMRQSHIIFLQPDEDTVVGPSGPDEMSRCETFSREDDSRGDMRDYVNF